MAKRYVSKSAWEFQYILDNGSDRYKALIAQGCTASATPYNATVFTGVKVMFPGSGQTDNTNL